MRKSTTIHVEEELPEALRIQAATSSESMSDYVNRALREQLTEGGDDTVHLRWDDIDVSIFAFGEIANRPITRQSVSSGISVPFRQSRQVLRVGAGE